jgi:hypothetical protein
MKHRLEPDYEMMVEGEPDLKPFKVDRVTADDQFVSRVAEYATEAEAMSRKRRGDWHYRISVGGKRLWPTKK